MLFQNYGVDFPQSRLDGLGLGQDIDAILIVLDHADNLVQMSLGNFQPVNSIPMHRIILIPHGGSVK